MKYWFVGFSAIVLALVLTVGSALGLLYLAIVVLPVWAGIPLLLVAVIAAATTEQCKELGRDLLDR